MVYSMFQSMKSMVALLRHSFPPHPRRLCVVRTQCSVSPIKEKRLAPAPPSRNLHIIFPGRGNMSGDMHYNRMAVCEYAQRYGRCIRCNPRRTTNRPHVRCAAPAVLPAYPARSMSNPRRTTNRPPRSMCSPRCATSLPGAFLGNPRYFPGRRAVPLCLRQAKRASGDSLACSHPQGGIT